MHYCGPHANNYNGLDVSRIDSAIDPSVAAGPSDEDTPANTAVQGLLPQLDIWIREWEEIWGPATIHNTSAEFEEKRRESRRIGSTAAYVPRLNITTAEARQLVDERSTWSVPNVVIDPILRLDEEREVTSNSHLSVDPPGASILRGRDQPSLPSLKSSGLLDVFPDESAGSRSSGTSTPVKPPGSWPLGSSTSPRPSLLSPSLPSAGGSTTGGNSSVSLLSHSQSFQHAHLPQGHLQIPMFRQSSSPNPSPGIVGPSPKQEAGTHAAVAIFGPHRVT